MADDKDTKEDGAAERVSAEAVTADNGADKGGINKKILFIVIPAFLLAIGAGLYLTGVIGPFGGDKSETVQAEAAEETASTGGAFYALPDIIVNLTSDAGARFLKLRVQLELNRAEDLPTIEIVAPRVIDQFQTYLREMRVEDLRGSAGIYRLRQELLYRVNLAAYPVKVKDVLFQEMLIQ